MYTDTTPAITSVAEVLDGLAGVRDQSRLLDQGLVILAVEWAKHHPRTSAGLPMLRASYGPYDHQAVFDEIAAQGAASFDDDAVAEFAIAAGLTAYSARKLIRESIMLVHFLPRVWARVLAGGLDVWRARNLAGDCFGLTPRAIEFVDAQMSERTARITKTLRESVIGLARRKFMPEVEESHDAEARAARSVDIPTHVAQRGVVELRACLDLPDALALDAALTAGAQALADAGSDAPMGTRRAWALGDLARAATGQGALFPYALPDTAEAEWVPAATRSGIDRPHWNGKGAAPPSVKLFIHLDGAPADPADVPARVEGPGIAGEHVTSMETVREWFTRPTRAGAYLPRLSLRPVLDLAEHLTSSAYTPPEKTKEQVQLSHSTCVFPFCTRPSHRCDADHTIPWKPEGEGGATCTCNLVSLCRTHHRLKTHGDNAPPGSGEHNTWSYTCLGEGEYYWSGPRGWAFIRTNTGTYDASTRGNGGAPLHPSLGASGGDQQNATEDLIGRLLRKASLTRGVHAADFAPLWSLPPHRTVAEAPEDCPGDEWDENGDYIGPTTFFTVPANFLLAA